MEDLLAQALKFSACLEIHKKAQTGRQGRLNSSVAPQAMAMCFQIKMEARIQTQTKLHSMLPKSWASEK